MRREYNGGQVVIAVEGDPMNLNEQATCPATDYRTIPLTKGMVAIVDSVDFKHLSAYKWQAQWNQCTRSFKAKREGAANEGVLKGKSLLMHREILSLRPGDKRQVDHVNHDTLDNRRSNLRIASHLENNFNKRPYRNNKSGFKGVSWSKKRRKFVAQFRIHGKVFNLGTFSNAKEAALVYDSVAKDQFGSFAFLNFPEGLTL